MAYNYYQTQTPGWGTAQFQFGAPPRPTFQPQPTWGGYDFYNAHAMNPDPGLFDTVMTRIRNGLGLGISHSEARSWHKKVYSGLMPLTQLLPEDIGAAAAYEAYRTWKYNSFLYEPLSAERDAQREGLVGMAIAETQRLWQYSQRAYDTYGLRAACEAAASTASMLSDRLFAQSAGLGGRASSFASSGDPYYEDSYRRRSRSRHNSFSTPTVVRVGGSPFSGSAGSPYAGTPGAVPMPIPGTAMSAGAYSAGAGMPGSYGAGAGMPGSYGSTPYGAGVGLPGSYSPYRGASPNPFAAAGIAAPQASQYTFNGVPVGYGAGAAPYAGSTGYTLANGQAIPPGSTVIINHKPSRSRRHSTASHHHRSGSHSSRYDDYERERERELEARDWERADRERHERDRLRWEREERERESSISGGYGMDDYGRYGPVGRNFEGGMGAGLNAAGFGYGGRY
ncbi:hypothetical protein L226DRAFT_531691 [Lentinus tigrinus ALCF2SS1-7]|uniref:uncharacterized protein n=1 Tax=Lentinus tigrinus ALCF2SS1-7 TaxID=1328758 RepID=UPI0011663875|nr:hypothetical protein L226DRAFT_531691 [Lentinus tigrinus ALCF2SS1-7]